MTKADELVRDLLVALEAISNAAHADKPYATSFIAGAAEQAIKNAHAKMVRNADGYLVCAGER